LFFERHGGGERAILVHLDGQDPEAREDPQEFQELALSAGAETVSFVTVPRQRPTAKFLIGSGKVGELRDLVQTAQADLVIFNHVLTPSQERNLERVFECRVLDRTGLILDIFAQRARTHEGKLQVELAQLDHMSTRLVRGWTHLERQKGGIGLRGPGETQLETDRRLLRVRIRQIKQKLDKVRSQREQARRGRQRADIPSVSLVGYTNAGKSTLMRALTGSEVLVANKLFATLDTTVRVLHPESVPRVLVSDTVGFIKNLPHGLVASFKSTLDEALDASLLLHVIDASDPGFERQLEVTDEVLKEIGADEVPRIRVFNKIDHVGDAEAQAECEAALRARYPDCVVMSARRPAEVELLRKTIVAFFQQDLIEAELLLPWSAQQLRKEIYANCEVLEERAEDEGAVFRLRGEPDTVERLRAQFALTR